MKQDVQLEKKLNKEDCINLELIGLNCEKWKLYTAVEQGCIKLIKSHSKDVYNATKVFH